MLCGESALIMNYRHLLNISFRWSFVSNEINPQENLAGALWRNSLGADRPPGECTRFPKKSLWYFSSTILYKKYKTLSNCADSGELSVIAGQQVELLETREEEVSNSILNDYYLQ